MAPKTRRPAALAAAAEPERRPDAIASSPELLGIVFQHLPPVEQVVTVSRLNRAWRAWSAPRAAALRQERRTSRRECVYFGCSVALTESAIPLWAVKEVWSRLRYEQERKVLGRAAQHGDLCTFAWLHNHGWRRSLLSDYAQQICATAACGGHQELLQYLHANGYSWGPQACANAAEGGHLALLQWLRANGCPWEEKACVTAAARGGRLNVLQYLHANGCPWDKKACAAAAGCGHLEVLQYLHANGCPWDTSACSDAAGCGHLEVLQYLHANGCPWDTSACSDAAHYGHLEVLQYLHANGCPWDSAVTSAAASQDRLEVLQYLHANGCPTNILSLLSLAPFCKPRIVLWLKQQGLLPGHWTAEGAERTRREVNAVLREIGEYDDYDYAL